MSIRQSRERILRLDSREHPLEPRRGRDREGLVPVDEAVVRVHASPEARREPEPLVVRHVHPPAVVVVAQRLAQELHEHVPLDPAVPELVAEPCEEPVGEVLQIRLLRVVGRRGDGLPHALCPLCPDLCLRTLFRLCLNGGSLIPPKYHTSNLLDVVYDSPFICTLIIGDTDTTGTVTGIIVVDIVDIVVR